jgi:hypothetical protein
MGHQNTRRYWLQQIVKVAVPAAGLVADFESIGQAFKDSHHLIDGPHLGAVDGLPGLVQHTNRNTFTVDVEPDVNIGASKSQSP